MALQASPSSPNRIPIRSEKQGKTYIIILAEQHSPLCTFSSWEKNQYNKYNSDSFIKYIDLYSELSDDEGNLKKEYSDDALHLNDEGYKVVTSVLKNYL